MKYLKPVLLIVLVTFGLVEDIFSQSTDLAKFEPEHGCLVFIGQDLGAIGGLDNYNEGYMDYFPAPAGITTYTNIIPGSRVFGFTLKGNDGIRSMANWGSGDVYAQMQLDDPDFNNCALAIGLAIIDNEKAIVEGKRDSLIHDLGNWIKDLGKRPVFLRIGYEFDGHDWNHYDRISYIEAWKYIHDTYEKMEITNIAYVWQSKGFGTKADEMEDWYPGDDYVDWCAYSYLINPDMEMLKFSRKHGKPVFIAEATPIIMNENGETIEVRLANQTQAKMAWIEWFTGFFNTIVENRGLIKAFSFINVDWPSQEMWKNAIPFKYVDSRIQLSNYLIKNWLNEISKENYINAYDDLWRDLWHEGN